MFTAIPSLLAWRQMRGIANEGRGPFDWLRAGSFDWLRSLGAGWYRDCRQEIAGKMPAPHVSVGYMFQWKS